MHRQVVVVVAIGTMFSPSAGQERVDSTRVESTRINSSQGGPTTGHETGLPQLEGVHGVQGVGQRRALPNRFEFRNNQAAGRQFEHSFGMTTDAQFRQHNMDNVQNRLIGESLYNNPWYWQNLGSLDTELMTGGTGLPIAVSGTDGDYYNPYMYDQWKTTSGKRHSGALTSDLGVAQPRRGERGQPAGQPAPAQSHDVTSLEPSPPPMLASDRAVLASHRLHTSLQADIDDSWSGRTERHLGRGVNREKQPLRYIGSGLRGLATAPAQSGLYDVGLSAYDLATLRTDQLAGRTVPLVGQAWNVRFQDLSQTAKSIDTRQEGVTPLPLSGDLQDTYQAMADRYASLHPASMSLEDRLAALDRDYRRMRGELITGPDWSSRHLAAAEPAEPLGPAGLTTDTTPPAVTEPGGEVPTDESDESSSVEVEKPDLSWEDYGLLLRHGQQLDGFDLGTPGRFNDLLEAAEQKLSEQDYFWAERRFNRALRFIPGHPLATAGMGHAQIGASLYLSAALTLESLLGFQPEMIDVTYGPELLPAKKDLDRAVSILTDRIRGDVDLDRYGFLLAYIGHQLDRADLVQAGLDAMRRGESDLRFVNLLEEVWDPALEDGPIPAIENPILEDVPMVKPEDGERSG